MACDKKYITLMILLHVIYQLTMDEISRYLEFWGKCRDDALIGHGKSWRRTI